ncbi:MAG: S1 family peptidase [Pseudobdellovibrionaceae bacterium]
MKWIFQLLFVAPVVFGSSRIIQGLPVHKTEQSFWKTVRLIELAEDGNTWVPNCTGSVIAPDLILAAGHCVLGVKKNHLRIAYEAQPLSFELQNNPKTRIDVLKKFKTSRIKDWVVHPDYGTVDYDHDLVVIRIEGTVPKSYSAVTILPKTLMSSIVLGQSYIVELVGYGVIQADPWVESEILRRTQVPAYFEGLHLIMDQTGGSGGCNGDSGGPAFMKIKETTYLVGVTHGATKDSMGCGQQGVWINPTLELEFINEAAIELKSNARF